MNRAEAARNISRSRKTGAAMIIQDAVVPSREQLIAMTIRAQQGDTRAREQVVRMTCRMAYKMAETYYLSWAPKLPSSALFCDVFQAAIEGLCVAIDKFDPATGNTFTTCANHWMRNYVQRRGIYPMISGIRIPEPVLIEGMDERDGMLANCDLTLDDTDYNPDSTIGRKIIDEYDLQQDAEANVEVERIMRLLADIDPRLPEITRLAMEGYDMSVAGFKFGISAERVRKLRIKADEVLREELQPAH